MPTTPLLTIDLLHDVLTELGTLARAEGKVIEVAIYGGSALMLASNFRIATRDVDAVADDDGQRVIERLAATIAARRGWPPAWLNDQVYPFLSEMVDGLDDHHSLYRSYPSEHEPGLRVFVPTAEYLLAMKLMAMRIHSADDAKDRTDILNLLAIVGLGTSVEAMKFLEAFYPQARVSLKVIAGLDELFARADTTRDANSEDSPHVAPAYLGRGRTPRT